MFLFKGSCQCPDKPCCPARCLGDLILLLYCHLSELNDDGITLLYKKRVSDYRIDVDDEIV